MGCQFCASTIAGYVRDLMPSELLLQIYETQRDAGRAGRFHPCHPNHAALF